MKKLFYSALAIIAIAACSKETEQPTVNPESATGGRTITIRASVDEGTKTAYENEKTFSWSAGDKISVQVHYTGDDTSKSEWDKITLTTTDGGEVAEFTGTVPANYEIVDGGLAFYPASSVSSSFVYNNNNPATVTLAVVSSPTKANPMGLIPLVGQLKNPADATSTYDFQFKTATGIVKVTLNNVPAEMNAAWLYESGNPISGTFTLNDENALEMANETSGGSSIGRLKVNLASPVEGETRTVYFTVPEGILPAGTKFLATYSSNSNIFLTKTLKNDIPVERNTITDLGTIDLPTNWTSLGTGKIYDTVMKTTFGANTNDYTEVEIQKSNFYTNQYRLVNPYGLMLGTDADPYLKLTINHTGAALNSSVTATGDGIVTWNTYNTGYTYSGNNVILRSLSIYTGVTEADFVHSMVLATDADGNPTNIQLAPCYYYTTSTAWNYSKNNLVQIAMPGYDFIDKPFDLEVNNEPVNVENGEVTLGYTVGAAIETVKFAISAVSTADAKSILATDAAVTVNADPSLSGTVNLTLPAEYGTFYVSAQAFHNGYAVESFNTSVLVAASQASPEYLAWLGDWTISTPRVQNNVEYTDTWTIEEGVKNASFIVRHFGGNTMKTNDEDWLVTLLYDSANNTVTCANGQVVGAGGQLNSGADYTPTLLAKVLVGSSNYRFSGDFTIFTGSMNANGQIELTPGTVYYNSTNYSITGVQIFGVTASGASYWKTETPLPNVLVKDDGGSSVKQNSVPSLKAEKDYVETAPEARAE